MRAAKQAAIYQQHQQSAAAATPSSSHRDNNSHDNNNDRELRPSTITRNRGRSSRSQRLSSIGGGSSGSEHKRGSTVGKSRSPTKRDGADTRLISTFRRLSQIDVERVSGALDAAAHVRNRKAGINQDGSRIKTSERSFGNANGASAKVNTRSALSKLLAKTAEPHLIDFVGINGEAGAGKVKTNGNLLCERTIDLLVTKEGQLSARGIHHRPLSYFAETKTRCTNTLSFASQTDYGSTQMALVYFQRARASEHLGDMKASIRDYTKVSTNKSIHICSH
jgi:hypothetical protein